MIIHNIHQLHSLILSEKLDSYHPLPLPLRHNLHPIIRHHNRRLVINQIRSHIQCSGQFLQFIYSIIRKCRVIQMRMDSHINQAEALIGFGGQGMVAVGGSIAGHDHTAGAQAYVNYSFQQLWQQLRQARLLHPVCQILAIAATNQQRVSILKYINPQLSPDTGQGGKFQ